MMLRERWKQWNWNRKNLGMRPTEGGLQVPVESFADWIVFREVFDAGVYDVAIAELLDVAEPGALVVDLGANVGYFALRLLDRQRVKGKGGLPLRIVGVEASPRTFRELEARLSAQPFPVTPELHHGWVGEREGTARVREESNHFAARAPQAGEAGESVRCVDLEAMLNTGVRIALLKCDIEGAEEEFVRNYPALLRRTDRVCIETHSRALRDYCLGELRRAGLTDVGLLSAEGEGEGVRSLHLLRRAAP